MKRLLAFGLCVFGFSAVAADTKKETAAQNPSQKADAIVGKSGTLELKTVPNGAVAVFTSKQPKSTTCSGSCSGVFCWKLDLFRRVSILRPRLHQESALQVLLSRVNSR